MSDLCCDTCPDFDIDIFRGLTILVVDDTQTDLCLITYVLESYGIQVIATSNASQAFDLIKHESIDLLISGIDLPGESGYSLIQKIRTLTPLQTRDIPAIALSSNAHKQIHQQALASGFQTHITKPSSPTQLITEIAKLLFRSRKSSSSLFDNYS
ncbi:MAG: response regulator [Komarekiella atlantica HA4396-MV6]|nr:response regulator [Komarekiella atlantica HA4396-MV6]